MRSLASLVFSARPCSPRRAWRLATAPLAALPVLLGACGDEPLPLEPSAPVASVSVAPATLRTPKGEVITGDAAVFAQSLKEIGGNGEIIVWLKEPGTARPSAE
ncbi:MAG TPA: hypothetical protein VF613_08215, partial [Longimicrobium sp.]